MSSEYGCTSCRPSGPRWRRRTWSSPRTASSTAWRWRHERAKRGHHPTQRDLCLIRARSEARTWMSSAILHFAEELMSSWWIYLALWGFAALDGFFPAIPSETLVVAAGVFV